MTRQFIIWTVFLTSTILIACGDRPQSVDKPEKSDTYTIPDIQLPFKIRCDNFPRVHDSINFTIPPPKHLIEDTSTFFGKIVKGDLTILIKNKTNDYSPILYTVDKTGKIVDTLKLLDRPCFVGTDSHYLPWIEITKDLTITRTDTSYYSELKSADNPKTKKTYELTMTTDTAITIDKFIIASNGQITKTK